MKILIADDDPVSLLYLEDVLLDWGYEVICAHDGQQACDLLQQPDAPLLAIIDWMMPGMAGTEVCKIVREKVRDRYIYLIVMTSRTETQFVVEAMNAGADDFISKPFKDQELQVRLRAGRRIIELEQQLRTKATHDALTGIFNRGAVLERLENELARNARDARPLAVLFADLDNFKSINDQYGHLAGDTVLREVTERISAMLRPFDTIGRFGGEELIVLLPTCDLAGAQEVGERIRAGVANTPVATTSGVIGVTLSIGVAVVDDQVSPTVSEVLLSADEAMYRAKGAGKNRIEMARSGAWRRRITRQTR